MQLLRALAVAAALAAQLPGAIAHRTAVGSPRATAGGADGLRKAAGRLLQSSAGEAAAATGRSAAPLPLDFFSEDPQKMAEMPKYDGVHFPRPKAPHSLACKPQCNWRCGPRKECNQVCEPVCLPPECRTICRQSTATCETRCAAPQCAVVCPHKDCTGGGCGKCGTVCSEPVCTTQCSDSCESVCEKPKCTWKCHEGLCPKPHCQLDCTGLHPCTVTFPVAPKLARPAAPGEQRKVVSEATASFDPTVLSQPVQPPPPWVVQALPTGTRNPPLATTSTPQPPLPPLPTPPGPVRALKLRWAAEDARKRRQEEEEAR